jgi:hypothetical protein
VTIMESVGNTASASNCPGQTHTRSRTNKNRRADIMSSRDDDDIDPNGGRPDYHNPLAGFGGAPPAYSALTLRLVLATLGYWSARRARSCSRLLRRRCCSWFSSPCLPPSRLSILSSWPGGNYAVNLDNHAPRWAHLRPPPSAVGRNRDSSPTEFFDGLTATGPAIQCSRSGRPPPRVLVVRSPGRHRLGPIQRFAGTTPGDDLLTR